MKSAEEYFLNDNNNCAETVLHLAADRFGLEIAPEDFKLLGGFGGGLGCGKTCGALCGCIAAIGRKYIETVAHKTDDFKPKCIEMVRRFETEFGSCDCADIKPRYFDPAVRCFKVVQITEKILADYIAELDSKN